MSDIQLIRQAVVAAIDEINPLLPPDIQFGTSDDSVLFDPENPLDSLDLVNLVAAVEEAVEKSTGRNVPLPFDELTLPGSRNPLATVQSLVNYISGKLAG